jgi:hypothetical protein
MIELSFTSLEFLQRFTFAERTAFRALAATDNQAADYLNLVSAAAYVNNLDPDVIAGMQYLVSIGFLTESRSTEIMGTEG